MRRISHISLPASVGRQRQWGVTLLEMMLAVAVIAVLSAIAVPSYGNMMERMRVTTAVRDLAAVAQLVQRYYTAHNFTYPDSLAQLTGVPAADPWGQPYQYLRFGAPGANGQIRKDHNLHPLNSDFDLYSRGPDSLSSPALTSAQSRDDIIWARDGGFVGKAENF